MQRVSRTLGVLCLLVGLASLRTEAQEPPAAAPAAAPDVPAAAPPAPPAPADAEGPPEEGPERITMDFQDVELAVLVKFISQMTGRNFIIDEKVKGKITIISPSKITKEEAYNVFLSVLQVKGFTTVPSGSVIKIVPSPEAKGNTIETIMRDRVGPLSDEFITRLVPLTNVDGSNIVPIIQPLISPNGLIAAYGATNTMIVIDSAANIERIVEIVKELDVPDRERQVEVVRMNYAFATEIAATLAQVLEEPPQGGTTPGAVPAAPAARPRGGRNQPPAPAAPGAGGTAAVQTGGTGERAYKIIPDERTNSLIVVAGTIQMRRIKDLITRLDVPLPLGTGRIHVYYLKYANSFEIVPVLGDLIGNTGNVGGIGGGLFTRGISGSTAARGGRLGRQGGIGGLVGADSGFGGLGGLGSLRGGFGSRAQGLGGGRFGGPGGFGAPFGGGGAAGGGVASASGGGGGEFEGEVRVTADPSTNALIIYASPQDYQTLKRVIEMIDVRRRQVYVEAVILEVRVDKDRNLGIELQGGTSLPNGVGVGRTNFGTINPLIANPGSLTGLILAAVSSQTVRLPNGAVVPAQQALLTAAQSNTNVNILSAPTILTTDNQEAEIVVGQNLPFLSSTSTSETNLNNTFQTVERRDVGITLRLTPQISEGGMVRLEIFQEVSAPIPSAVAGIDPSRLGPATTIRSATTSAVVRDGHTVVIGGLISDDITNAHASVPYISDIPVIGNFFRASQATRRKINLLIFLTPHIIRDSHDHRDLSIRERDKLKRFLRAEEFPNLRRDQLETPGWTPDLPPEPPPSEEGQNEPASYLDDDARRNRREAHASAATVETGNGAEERPSAEATENRHVLLASIHEQGTPPDALASKSGMVALNLPADSKLSSLFRRGGQYRYRGDHYEAIYQCLDTYRSPHEAQLMYPEGLLVDPASTERLHWRDIKDADSARWTALQ